MKIPFFREKKQIGLCIEVTSGTDVGLKRKRNEDNLLCLSGEESPPSVDAVLVVADGVGGHVDGDVASQMAVDAVGRLIVERLLEQEPHSDEWPDLLARILEDASSQIHKEALYRQQAVPMGTTCTMAVVSSGTAYIAHAGDSRAYLYRNGNLTQLTTDHTWVQQQVSQGRLTTEEASVHPRRNIVTQALGLGPDVEVETITTDLQSDDILLIFSDGVHGLIEDRDIASILNMSSLLESKDRLIDRAKEEGGYDNITVALARVY